ncbi:MAG: NAD(P)-dependent oxidoreductase [Sporolactobacillus sp.]
MSASLSANNLEKIFEQVTPDIGTEAAMDEANRCLYCYDAPCKKACPTGIDIPSFIHKIATGNMKGSAQTIMSANPVGATCARVCPTEELCEGACVFNSVSLPIRIGDLQRYSTNWAMKSHQTMFHAGSFIGKSVAVIGSGPAGLSAARELARLGYKVEVFEKKEKAGGLDTYGIVPFRLPQSVSLWEVDQVKQLGVTIHTEIEVGKDISSGQLVHDYDAVILAAGMGKVPASHIPGEHLKGVFDAIQLIESVKDKQQSHDFGGKKAIVIGAGNTAIDAATCLKRLGASTVQMVYRRSEKEMTAYPSEYAFAKQENVIFQWLTQPKEIIGDASGRVTDIRCVHMTLGGKDETGRATPMEIKGSDFNMSTDIVVRAIGQERHIPLIDLFSLEHDHGAVKVNPETHQTSHPKVYAAGDICFSKLYGEAMVVSAAKQGVDTAHAIHKQLSAQ